MRQQTQTSNIYRFLAILACICILIAGLCYRLMDLHVNDRAFLQRQGDVRTVRVVEVPTTRGMITDRHGEVLAVSTPVHSVWINPQAVTSGAPKLELLANLLNMPLATLEQKLTQHQQKEFVYLKRHIRPDIAEKIRNINLPGVHLKVEHKRYYPAGEVASHVVGFTDIDQKGLEGVELAFQEYLQGVAGKKEVLRDRLGREVEFLQGITPMQPGQDIALSIDQRLQFVAYRALQDAVNKHRAKSGSAVVLSVETGEVLAMVNQPTYNPNATGKRADPEHYRNRAITDFLEPGSVAKAFSMLSVLESGNYTPSTFVNTAPGILHVKGGVVRDPKNLGQISLETILKRSSNVGMAKMVLDLPPENLLNLYSRLGFGSTTGSYMPGESSGLLRTTVPSSPFELATMAFGYAFAVTPLQLARAYAIIGADGVKRDVSFVKLDQAPPGTRVISADISRHVSEMLHAVVEENPLSKARVAGYEVAGKTGTARLLGKSGYLKDKHVAVFGGLAPAASPKFAIAVTIHEPQAGKFYSNQVAAPIFSEIAAGALRIFDVSPYEVHPKNVVIAQSGNNHS